MKILVGALAELGRVEGRDYVLIRSGVMYGPETQRALDEVMKESPDLLVTGNLGLRGRGAQADEDAAGGDVGQRLSGRGWRRAEPCAPWVQRHRANDLPAGSEVFAKLVQLVHELKPGMKRIGVLMSYVPPFNPRPETNLVVGGMRRAAAHLGVELQVYEVAASLTVAMLSCR